MHITGTNNSMQLSSRGPLRGTRCTSNQCALIRAGVPYQLPAEQACFLPYLWMLSATSYILICTEAHMLYIEWHRSSSPLYSWMGLLSRVLARWGCLNHLHVSAGLESFKKVTCGCHIFLSSSSALWYVPFSCICSLAWGWPAKHACDKYICEVYLMVLLFLAEGIDFYYGSKQHAQKMVDFLQCTVPCR